VFYAFYSVTFDKRYSLIQHSQIKMSIYRDWTKKKCCINRF